MTSTTFRPGTRVRFVKQWVLEYPFDGVVEVGDTGTIAHIDDEETGGSIWVALDKEIPDLAEWNGEVQMWIPTPADFPQMDAETMAAAHPFTYFEAREDDQLMVVLEGDGIETQTLALAEADIDHGPAITGPTAKGALLPMAM